MRNGRISFNPMANDEMNVYCLKAVCFKMFTKVGKNVKNIYATFECLNLKNPMFFRRN